MYKREFEMAARVLQQQEAEEETKAAHAHATLRAQETDQLHRLRLSLLFADKATKLMDVRPKGPSLLTLAQENYTRLKTALATTTQELAQARGQERFLLSEVTTASRKQAASHTAALEAVARNIATLVGRVSSLQGELAQAQHCVDRATQIYALEAKWFPLFQLATPVAQRLRQNFGKGSPAVPTFPFGL
jgi:hypothetical protein